MSAHLLAACLIVKNEEVNLPDCLASLRSAGSGIDEICVYDTGSTDATIALAEAAGARVVRGYWDDDFSRARNAALDMCHAKWALIIDADERLVASHAGLVTRLRDALTAQMTGFDMLKVRVVNVLEDGRAATMHDAPRILRVDRVRYARAVHEEPRLIRTDRVPRYLGLPPDIAAIRHVGYAPAGAIEARGQRNLSAAETDVVAGQLSRSDEVKSRVDRARTLEITGDVDGARQLLEEAWEIGSDTAYWLWAGETLAELQMRSGHVEEAAIWVRRVREAGGNSEYADLILAQIRNRQGRHQEARDLLLGLKEPKTSAGLMIEPATVIEQLFIAEASLRRYDEALPYAIHLIAGYGRAGYAAVLLRMWQGTMRDLAELLSFADKGRLQGFVAELRAGVDLPAGAHELADLLEAGTRVVPPAVNAVATRPASGTAFGLSAR